MISQLDLQLSGSYSLTFSPKVKVIGQIKGTHTVSKKLRQEQEPNSDNP